MSATFKQKAHTILAKIEGDESQSQNYLRVVKDLDSVEKKLTAMRASYTQSYERAIALEKRIEQCRAE